MLLIGFVSPLNPPPPSEANLLIAVLTKYNHQYNRSHFYKLLSHLIIDVTSPYLPHVVIGVVVVESDEET